MELNISSQNSYDAAQAPIVTVLGDITNNEVA
jgi:hypothetical protein